MTPFGARLSKEITDLTTSLEQSLNPLNTPYTSATASWQPTSRRRIEPSMNWSITFWVPSARMIEELRVAQMTSHADLRIGPA